MDMKCIQKWLLLALAGCVSVTATAQQPLSSKEMVSITPMVCDALDLPGDAKASLQNKLNQMTMQNGFGASSELLVLTANVVTLDKQVTTTAPAQYVVDLEVSIYVVDVVSQVTIAETSFTVKGIDRLENKAVIQAINRINARSPQVKTFMESCRVKIIDYYTTRIPTLLTKADALAKMHQYGGALAILASIPENVDEYPAVADKMTSIYTEMLDCNAVAAIREAKGMIAVRKYEEAVDALQSVDPSSTRSKEAFGIIQSVKQQLDAAEAAALAEKMRAYEQQREDAMRAREDVVMLRKAEIEASKTAGNNYSKSNAENKNSGSEELSFARGVNKWFMDKFK